MEDVTPDEWDWTIENNLTQVFELFQAVSKQMIDQGTGGSWWRWPRWTEP